MLNQIFSEVIFSLGFDGRPSDFLDPEYLRPWEAEAVPMENLFADNQNFVTP